MFPFALLIWAVTAPFDPRLRLLHRFTCFWGSLYTWMNPAWPVHADRAREDPRRRHLRDGREPPVAARHPGALPRLRALQVGLEDRELPDSADRLEHVAQPLHQAQARRPRERGPDDAGVPGDALERQLDHDVSGGHPLSRRAPARLQDRRLRAGARRRARRSCRSSSTAPPTRCPSGVSCCRADTRSGSRSSTRCRPNPSPTNRSTR